MRPGDTLTVDLSNGVRFRWAVTAVLLGAVGQESVVELEPIGETPNAWGKTLCPEPLLAVLVDGGRVVVETPEAPR